jgi:hypothetical protein
MNIRSVRTKVEEELSNGEHGEFATSTDGLVSTSNDTEHESSDEETGNLNGLTAEDLDESDGEEVTRNVTGSSNDQITVGSDEKRVVLIATFGEADLLQEHRLVQVDAVESNIDEEPT